MHCYLEIDFNGPMRPDGVSALEGEDNFTPSYTTCSRHRQLDT